MKRENETKRRFPFDSYSYRVERRYVTYQIKIISFCRSVSSELKKLSEESLTRQPEEVFDIICKLGEG